MIVIWQSWGVLNVCSNGRGGAWRAVRPGGFNMRAGGPVLVFSFFLFLYYPLTIHTRNHCLPWSDMV